MHVLLKKTTVTEVMGVFSEEKDAIKFEDSRKSKKGVWYEIEKIPFNPSYEDIGNRIDELHDILDNLNDEDIFNAPEYAKHERELIKLERIYFD